MEICSGLMLWKIVLFVCLFTFEVSLRLLQQSLKIVIMVGVELETWLFGILWNEENAVQ